MNYEETVLDLEQEGFTVEVEHYRYFEDTLFRYSRHKGFRNGKFAGFSPETKGGETIIKIFSKYKLDLVGIGHAVCSRDDTYDYKKGKKIALHRAILNLYNAKPIPVVRLLPCFEVIITKRLRDLLLSKNPSKAVVKLTKNILKNAIDDLTDSELKEEINMSDRVWRGENPTIPDVVVYNILEGKDD